MSFMNIRGAHKQLTPLIPLALVLVMLRTYVMQPIRQVPRRFHFGKLLFICYSILFTLFRVGFFLAKKKGQYKAKVKMMITAQIEDVFNQ